MKIISPSTLPVLILIATVALGGCVQTHPAAPAPGLSAAEIHVTEVDLRKDELLRDLATCESGGHGETDHPIYGGRGLYVGRFQFMPRTVINYVQEMDGRQLSTKEATELAHNYDQAAQVAKYMIFERGRISEWPLCNRKLQLAKQVAQIQAM